MRNFPEIILDIASGKLFDYNINKNRPSLNMIQSAQEANQPILSDNAPKMSNKVQSLL